MPTSALLSRLGSDAAALAPALAAEIGVDRNRLAVLFPALPRRFGRDAVRGGKTRLGPATVDLDAFRRCDLAAAWLLAQVGATADEIQDLFAHGDMEERAMLLRAQHFLPLDATTVKLLGEVQRTNIVLHLEAALCDGDLLLRVLQQGWLDENGGNRLLLKLAFLDLPLQRAYGAETRANPELSRMLQDLATEREAAGRSVWRDTWRLIGRAPCDGTVARLIGGLEHGDDGVRLAAAEGLLALNRPDLRPFAAERLPREPRMSIQKLLRRLIGEA